MEAVSHVGVGVAGAEGALPVGAEIADRQVMQGHGRVDVQDAVAALPDANWAVMIPIFAAGMMAYARTWRPSVADILVIGIASAMAYSEYLAAGYSEAQNLGAGSPADRRPLPDGAAGHRP